MKTLQSTRDLQDFGINPLTGEACKFGMRVLCDLTEKGRDLVCVFLGGEMIDGFPENWNTQVGNEKAVSSVMLTHRALSDLMVFALLRDHPVVLVRGGSAVGLVEADTYYQSYLAIATDPTSGYTIYRNPHAASPTTRNEHAFTGRTE